MGTDRHELPPLRAVFMGTPEFAVPTLVSLLDAGCEIVGVYTQPDRRSGRGRRLTPPPVKQAAIERGLPVFQPASLRRDADARQQLVSLKPDLILVAAYGLFLPADTLDVPPLGALNIHPSLLPKHRGPSPVATAILEGDTTTGVTLMQLDEGMDSGPIIAQQGDDDRRKRDRRRPHSSPVRDGCAAACRYATEDGGRARLRLCHRAKPIRRLPDCSDVRTAR